MSHASKMKSKIVMKMYKANLSGDYKPSAFVLSIGGIQNTFDNYRIYCARFLTLELHE